VRWFYILSPCRSRSGLFQTESVGPSRSRLRDRPNRQGSILGLHLNLSFQFGLFQEQLGDADAARVADADDSSLHGSMPSGAYNMELHLKK